MKRLSILLFLVAAALPGQFVPGRYLVELTAEPAITGRGRLAAVRLAQAPVRAAIAARGLAVRASIENVANILVVEASEQDAQALETLPGVERVRPVRVFRKVLDRAVILQKVTDAWPLAGGFDNAGRGVKIGIIDTGIDVGHPGLQDPTLSVPDGFPKLGSSSDLANTNSKVIVARNYGSRGSARDIDGHGTGVAMIAAGRTAYGSLATITGVAPKAWLGNYKVFPDEEEGAPEDLILKAIDDAVIDGMDVLNLSLGSFPAESPDEDPLVRAVDRASDAGIIVVIAAGNEGPDNATIGSPATSHNAISVGNAYNDRVFQSSVRLEGAPAYVALPGSESEGASAVSGTVKDVAEVASSGLACSALPDGSLSGRIALILRGTCYFEDKLRNAERAGARAAIVYSHADSPDATRMDVGTARLPAVMVSNADGLDLKKRLRDDPGAMVTIRFQPSAVTVNADRLNNSSSRGPSVDLALKPEILAIGTSVYTAAPTAQGDARFQAGSGTSFSSPMVAGAAAVVKGARPNLTAAQYRSLLINSASSFPIATAPQSAMNTGSGLLNVSAAVKSAIAVVPQVLGFGATTDTGDIVRTLTLTHVGSSPDTFTLSVKPAKGGSTPRLARENVELSPGVSQEVQIVFSPSGAATEYSGAVVIRSSSGDTEARIPYWFAVPSGKASSILVIPQNPDASTGTGAKQVYFVRPTDSVGMPVAEEPHVSVSKGDGIAVSVGTSRYYPGFYVLELRLGSTPGDNTFLIESAGASYTLTITVK